MLSLIDTGFDCAGTYLSIINLVSDYTVVPHTSTMAALRVPGITRAIETRRATSLLRAFYIGLSKNSPKGRIRFPVLIMHFPNSLL
jgi:hypothetical protein